MKNELAPKVWIDMDNKEIPVRLVTKFDRAKQRKAVQMLRKGLELEKQMRDFKSEIAAVLTEMQDTFCAENDVQPTPAFSFYNFNKEIKVERTRNTAIKFDEAFLDACKQKFDEFLSQVTDENNMIIIELVKDAFAQRKGRPDAQKLLSLLGYRQKVSHPLFQEALSLLDQSIGKGNSKYYFKISELQTDGSYRQVCLDFASI